ncbi:unnamed protein product [Cuscuta epithymum]|uniref:Uncharacterized protein n=1 Tax=Cuscuta epithymum TaxID=186058 RepID=A0AAV0CYL6_9ASTE|nr:unnamed protein product [Cuscuta epithymum]
MAEPSWLLPLPPLYPYSHLFMPYFSIKCISHLLIPQSGTPFGVQDLFVDVLMPVLCLIVSSGQIYPNVVPVSPVRDVLGHSDCVGFLLVLGLLYALGRAYWAWAQYPNTLD